MRAAVPAEVSATVPRGLVPSVKVMEPVARRVLGRVWATVAVKVTGVAAGDELAELVRMVVVGMSWAIRGMGVDVLGA